MECKMAVAKRRSLVFSSVFHVEKDQIMVQKPQRS